MNPSKNSSKKVRDFFISRSSSVSSNVDGTCRPQLTSLVDIMTILLVFLIKSFSVEGQIVSPREDIELPFSVSANTLELHTAVDITRNALFLGDKKVVELSEFANRDTLFIAELFSALENIGHIGNSNIMIQSDKYVPYNIIKRVMYTCSRAGIKDFSVLVIRDE